jgi:tripartite-type tricarboxylate transporter receptor subunit TctC
MNLAIKCALKVVITLSTCASAFSQPADTPTWPSKPIRLLVAHGVGGTTDKIARELARQLEQRWNQAVVVDNKPKAGGILATQQIARAPADGYSLLMQNSSLLIGARLMHSTDTQPAFRQILPIAKVASAPNIWVSLPGTSLRTGQDALHMARTQSVVVGSCGSGKPQHFAIERLRAQWHLHLQHIPFSTCAQATMGVLSGTVRSSLISAEAVMPQLKSGQLVAWAVTSRQRHPALPQVPSLHELGLHEFDQTTWYGIFAPQGLPPSTLNTLYKSISAEIRTLAQTSNDAATLYTLLAPQAFAAQLEREHLQLSEWSPDQTLD